MIRKLHPPLAKCQTSALRRSSGLSRRRWLSCTKDVALYKWSPICYPDLANSHLSLYIYPLAFLVGLSYPIVPLVWEILLHFGEQWLLFTSWLRTVSGDRGTIHSGGRALVPLPRRWWWSSWRPFLISIWGWRVLCRDSHFELALRLHATGGYLLVGCSGGFRRSWDGCASCHSLGGQQGTGPPSSEAFAWGMPYGSLVGSFGWYCASKRGWE